MEKLFDVMVYVGALAGVRELSSGGRRRSSGGSPHTAIIPFSSMSRFILQGVKAKVGTPNSFSTMAEITTTKSLYLLWKYQKRRVNPQQAFRFIVSSVSAHSFWP